MTKGTSGTSVSDHTANLVSEGRPLVQNTDLVRKERKSLEAINCKVRIQKSKLVLGQSLLRGHLPTR